MDGTVTHLRQLKNSCLDALTSRLTRWTKPLVTSSPLATLTDLGRSKSELIAEKRRAVKAQGPLSRTDDPGSQYNLCQAELRHEAFDLMQREKNWPWSTMNALYASIEPWGIGKERQEP